MAPSVTREMINQYSTNTTGGITTPDLFVREIDEFIPLMAHVNADFIKKLPSKGSVNKLKYEFGESDLPPTTVKATATGVAAATSVTVDFPQYVQQYDVLLNLTTGEQLRVTAEPTTTLAVAREHGGSDPAAVTAGDVLKILGPAVPEGADTPTSPSSQGSLDFNYPQIFEYSWEVTHRGRVTPTEEFKSDRFKTMLKRGMEEAARDLNLTAIYGLRSMGDGTGTNPSTTGGARQFAKAGVVDKSGNPLELNDFLDALQDRYEDVGNNMAKEFWMTPKTKRIVNSFLNGMRLANVSDAKLNMKLGTLDTDFGEVSFHTDTEFPEGEMYSFNWSDLGRFAYEGGNWSTGMFSTQGWYDRGFLRGDFGFKWAAPRRRSAIIGFSTDTADYANYNIMGLQMAPQITVTP